MSEICLDLNPKLSDYIYYCSPLSDPDPLKQTSNMLMAVYNCKRLMEHTRYRVVAPHAFLPLVLNDYDPVQRQKALDFGVCLLRKSRGVYVGGNRISNGMKRELLLAAQQQIPIGFSSEEMMDSFLEIEPGYEEHIAVDLNAKRLITSQYSTFWDLVNVRQAASFVVRQAKLCLVDPGPFAFDWGCESLEGFRSIIKEKGCWGGA